MTMTPKIGIIEDDSALREGLALAFELEGYETAAAGTMAEGWRLLEAGGLALLILDCNLPDGSGFDLVRQLRASSGLPVLMLTARDSEMDEVKGLELGVDDFMRKPFSLAVLQARVRKILRRQEEPAFLSSGDITVDLGKGEVRKQGELLALSGTEQRLLLCFLEHPGQLLTKGQLLERIWDCEGSYVDENTLAVAIRRLRVKIEEDPGEPRRIRTVHGQGYLWQA